MKTERIIITSPYYLRQNFNLALKEQGVKLDLNSFKSQFRSIFWNSIWYFSIEELPCEFFIPYEDSKEHETAIKMIKNDLSEISLITMEGICIKKKNEPFELNVEKYQGSKIKKFSNVDSIDMNNINNCIIDDKIRERNDPIEKFDNISFNNNFSRRITIEENEMVGSNRHIENKTSIELDEQFIQKYEELNIIEENLNQNNLCFINSFADKPKDEEENNTNLFALNPQIDESHIPKDFGTSFIVTEYNEEKLFSN